MTTTIADIPPTFKRDLVPPTDPQRTIRVIRAVKGVKDIIALVDVWVGNVLIRRIKVRRGRGHSTYINYPTYHDEETGQWIQLVELSDHYEGLVRQAILQAVGEVAR